MKEAGEEKFHLKNVLLELASVYRSSTVKWSVFQI